MRFVSLLLSTVLAACLGSSLLFSPASAQLCGDVNCSGSVTSTDALAVLRKAVGLSSPLLCADDCSSTTTSTTTTTTTTSAATTTTLTTLPATTTTTLPQDSPCACTDPCPFLCPDKTLVVGECVISALGLSPGQCLCTALCPSLAPLCAPICDLSPCDLPCPAGGSVAGFCDTQGQEGCLCSNRDGPPCP